MQTGQNSIAPESSLPQLGQVRLSSVFMGLPALQPQSEPRIDLDDLLLFQFVLCAEDKGISEVVFGVCNSTILVSGIMSIILDACQVLRARWSPTPDRSITDSASNVALH
jgi:hypothetical protein